MATQDKLQFIRKNYQIVYSLVLIIFIPLAIIANTVIFARSFQSAIDRDLQSKAISIGDAVNAGIIDSLDNPNKLQERIEKINGYNNEVVSIDLLEPAGEDFKVVASLDAKAIGRVSRDMVNIIAWRQDQPVAFLTTSGSNNSIDNKVDFSQKAVRYWSVVMPIKDGLGAKHAVLSLKISVAEMDALTKQILVRSYVVLLLTVVIIILLLANNTRLFEYAALYRKIKEIDQMKDEFISVASHELRTPVTGIKGYVSMILDGDMGPISDKAKDSLKIVMSSADRLAVLVDDLLNVSRIEQGRMKLESKPMEINKIINEVISELSIQAKQKNLSLSFKPHKGESPLVSVDTDKFKQILINVIGNAIKYTLKGGVEVFTNEKDDKFLEIKVKDTGLGMSTEARSRLFEKFYRIQTEETAKITGTGLGLWITKQLVEMQGGKITVDSIEKVGTQIDITFPIVKK
ncbi:HAMP domain-containing histidine kinase [Candidatus Falkowbacteria bacterium]|nr:HAMP domain-containing histidine kinase [Candidatus Falkowbacteria bacterium]